MDKAPAFQWYPKDCDTDEKVRAMDDMEFGFYMRCLNHSWLNDGLPGDIEEIARVLSRPKAYLVKVWPRVGCCFELVNGRFVNQKQELQRLTVREFKESRRTAANVRWDARAAEKKCKNDARALQVQCTASASSSASASASEKPPAPTVPPPIPIRQPSQDFQARFEILYGTHPWPGFKADGQLRYLDILSNAVHPDKIADSIDTTHAEWVSYWAANPAAFKPGIGKYFEDEYYLRKPRDAPVPARKLSVTEQASILWKEQQEREKSNRT